MTVQTEARRLVVRTDRTMVEGQWPLAMKVSVTMRIVTTARGRAWTATRMTTAQRDCLAASMVPVPIDHTALLTKGEIVAPVVLTQKVVLIRKVEAQLVTTARADLTPREALAVTAHETAKVAVANTAYPSSTPEESHTPSGCAAPLGIYRLGIWTQVISLGPPDRLPACPSW